MWIVAGLFVVSCLACALAVVWGYHYFSRDLPRFTSVDDYRPNTVSFVYSADGTVVGEFFRERRYPIKLDDVPLFVRNSFLAAEDADFYRHPGIDLVSILRAVVKNTMAGRAKQGASTITQQVVKNLLLSREKKLERKIKEAILAYRLEKRLSKDGILQIYLNQIFFGNGAYGLAAAAKIYFHKEVRDLTLAESAMLAGLPKAPSRYSPLNNFEAAKSRQAGVLKQMVEAGFITKQAAQEAKDQQIIVYPESSDNLFHAPYYVSEVRRRFKNDWRGYNVDTDGLQIYTALDLKAYDSAERALQKGLRDVDKRRGWRGILEHIEASPDRKHQFMQHYSKLIQENPKLNFVYPALVESVSGGSAKVDLGFTSATIDLKGINWAKRRRTERDTVEAVTLEKILHSGDVIEVSISEETGADKKVTRKVILDQTPDIEGAAVLLDPNSGKVLTLIGGYSYQRSIFNRATQAQRQPGSAFKPVLYLAAVDEFRYTPSTIVYDEPRTFKVGDEYWTPGNFDEHYLGPITLRVALEKSRNLVSADIISRIGVDSVVRYAKKLGIESKLGRNPSLSLGSSEVNLLELTRAYGVFAARGLLFDTAFVTKVLDRDGNTVYDLDQEKLSHATQAVNEDSCFIMANMMKGVVDRGTATVVKKIGRPVAGKTGTSNEQMDTWFIGYTPRWVAGIWVGFDQKKNIGHKETGGRIAAPIWLQFMTEFLNQQDEEGYKKLVQEAEAEAARLGIEYVPPEPLQPLDFSVPEGVDPIWVNAASGQPAEPGSQGAIVEYFLKGTEPTQHVRPEGDVSYWDSPEL